jgi:hypothetical protein
MPENTDNPANVRGFAVYVGIDDESARSAWLFVTKVSKRYHYEDEAARRAFSEAMQRSAKHELMRTEKDKVAKAS